MDDDLCFASVRELNAGFRSGVFTRRLGLGLPIGLHVVGARHRDALVLRAARAYEAATPGVGRPPAFRPRRQG